MALPSFPGSEELTQAEKIQRYVYTCSYYGGYITGNLDLHISRFTTAPLFDFIKTSHKDFIDIVLAASEDPLLVRRLCIFYIVSEALNSDAIPEHVKLDIKAAVFTIIRSDAEFFDFIKYYTLLGPKRKQRITTSLKKMIVKFYQMKEPMEFTKLVMRQKSYHSWTHKDVIKICHYKTDNILCTPVIKYVLFGINNLPPTPEDDSKPIIEFIKKTHELRTTVDRDRAVALITELHATVDQVNSRFNKCEEIWLAALPEMTTRHVLQSLYRLFRFGLLKSSAFVAKVVEVLGDETNIRECDLHPLEVYIYLKFFQRGGKPLDPKLLEHFHKRKIHPESLKKVKTPKLPECEPVVCAIGRCLKLSYNNVMPTGKKFLITIEVTNRVEDYCFKNKRIGFYEAVLAIVRFISKVEKNVTIAVFNNDLITVLEMNRYKKKEQLLEHKCRYTIPSAPIDWARNKKKQVDVFINFMSSNWLMAIPSDIRHNMVSIPDALKNYSRKMKSPNVRVVKLFLGGMSTVQVENHKNILSIGGFAPEVPKLLEAFCRGHFC